MQSMLAGQESERQRVAQDLHDSVGGLLAAVKIPVSYTHLRAHETVLDLVCRLLLEKKKKKNIKYSMSFRSTKHTSTIIY